MANSDARDLLLPDDVHYSCISCGRSCEDWGEVGITADEADRLRRLPLFNPRLPPSAGPTLPFVTTSRRAAAAATAEQVTDEAAEQVTDEAAAAAAASHHRLSFRTTDEGSSRCRLLDDDLLCALHLAHGPEAKPATCRAFPLFFVDTPRATHAAVSFACTAVLHGLGDPLVNQRHAVAAVLAFATHRERRGYGIRLAAGEAMSYAAYETLEGELRSVLERAADVRAGLLAQARLLRQRAALPDLDPRPSPRLRQRCLDLFERIMGTPPRFRAPMTGRIAPSAESLLRRWVTHRLWRKDLLRGGEVAFGHALLIAETGLALTWADAQPGGLVEAIAQVERGLALHSNFSDRLEADPKRRMEASRLLLSPRAAASLLALAACDNRGS